MLFKRFKKQIICFFVVREITWHCEVLVLQKLEFGVNKLMQYLTSTHNNIKNSSNASEFNTLYLEELY